MATAVDLKSFLGLWKAQVALVGVIAIVRVVAVTRGGASLQVVDLHVDQALEQVLIDLVQAKSTPRLQHTPCDLGQVIRVWNRHQVESKGILNESRLYPSLPENFVITVIQFLAALDTDFPEILGVLSKILKSLGRHISRADVQALKEWNLSGYGSESFILKFDTAQHIELSQVV